LCFDVFVDSYFCSGCEEIHMLEMGYDFDYGSMSQISGVQRQDFDDQRHSLHKNAWLGDHHGHY